MREDSQASVIKKITFNTCDIQYAIRKIKNGRSPDVSYAVAEMLKCGTPLLVQSICEF